MCSPVASVSCLLCICFVLFTASPVQSNVRDLHKRSFASLGCLGVYNKATFAKLDRVCDDCYQLYRDDDLHQLCRKNCFKNDYFKKCIEALLLTHESEKFEEMVLELYGKK
ncbi:Ion transport peptide-like protein [Leptotrombidium deliense]|uniref:Ion transport peptide-like protein n=1 Tax=Leptotrombidium deliense TaxID=299467 RepID=A0A443SM20_9ACAR|nr:Ion transport peptide-like protein [Leptotrombidium deliense]